jgi:hypothetical protein
MGGLTFPFVVLPSIGAVISAYVLRDWRLAGAVAAGGSGLLLLLIASSSRLAVLFLPMIGGASLGALAVLPLLYLRPQSSVWTRMTLALVVTAAAGIAHLLGVMIRE